MSEPSADAGRVRLCVSGRVQGVGFRWFVRESARALDLAGWVRNQADGTVLLEARGDRAALAALRTAVARGPSAAVVDRVVELESHDLALPYPFAVER